MSKPRATVPLQPINFFPSLPSPKVDITSFYPSLWGPVAGFWLITGHGIYNGGP